MCEAKVIAFTCSSITVFLMVASAGFTNWVQADGWSEGLFTQCIQAGAPTPLPFGADPVPGCRRAHHADYVRGSAGLVVICICADFFGTLLTGLGLRTTDPERKNKYYRVAIYSLGVAVLTLFAALIIYPTYFSKEIANSNRRVWEFGFGFGAAWCSLIFMFVSLVLLICDREAEENFYKEREVDDETGDEEE